MGEVLSKAGYRPDLVLVSPAARAVETWDGMDAAFPKARVEKRKRLYDATPGEIAEEADRETTGAETVMVVGHNPGLQELAVNLLIESAGSNQDIEMLSAGFPTSAAAVFVFDEAGRASLEAVYYARDHRSDP